MMRKVKVVRYGQQPAMSKPGYSRGFNSGQFPVYYPGTEWVAPSTEVSKGLKPVPWDEANVEAEGGETAYVPDQGGMPAHFNINGPRHTEGGVPLNLPPDSFIYSDTKKMRLKGPVLEYFGKNPNKSYTPAEIAKQYDINKYRKILQNPDSDHIQVATAEMMIANYNKKLGALALVQEAKKGFPEGVPVAAMPFLMTYAIDAQQVLPDVSGMQQQGMPGMEQPMPAPSKKGGTTGTWAAPNYYQIGGTYSAQTEPEFGGNWMGQARSRKQMGGEQEQILQVIQMYAQATGQDPDEVMAQLQQMQPEEAQQALQQMAESLQQMQQQPANMQPGMYAYGGDVIPKAQFGEAGIEGLRRYTSGYKGVTNVDDLLDAYNRLAEANKNTEWYSWGWVPGSESNEIKNMQLEIAKRLHNVSQTATNSEERRKAADALHNLKTSWYSLGWIPGSDEFGIGLRAVNADVASIKMLGAENDKKAASLLQQALPAYTKAYEEVMYNPDAFSAEDAQLIMKNYKKLKQLERELDPRTRFLGTGAVLPDLLNIPLTLPGIEPSSVVSKQKTKKKGTVPFTTEDSLVNPGTPTITPEQMESLSNLRRLSGGNIPKAQFGDARVVRGVNDETNYMLPVDPTTGLPVVNLPEFTVEAEGIPMVTGTGNPYADEFRRRYLAGEIATGGIDDMGVNDPVAALALAAFKAPQAASWLFGKVPSMFKRKPTKEEAAWAEEAGVPLETAAKREGAREARRAASKLNKGKGKGAAPEPAPASSNQKRSAVEDDFSEAYNYAESPGGVNMAGRTGRVPKPPGVITPEAAKYIKEKMYLHPGTTLYNYMPSWDAQEAPTTVVPYREPEKVAPAPPVPSTISAPTVVPQAVDSGLLNQGLTFKDGQYFFTDPNTGQEYLVPDSAVSQMKYIQQKYPQGYNVSGQDTFRIQQLTPEQTDSMVQAELRAMGLQKMYGGKINKYQGGGSASGEVVSYGGKYYLRKGSNDTEINGTQAWNLSGGRMGTNPAGTGAGTGATATTGAGAGTRTGAGTAAGAGTGAGGFTPAITPDNDPNSMWSTGLADLQQDFRGDDRLKEALYNEWKKRPENAGKSIDKEQLMENFLKTQEQIYKIQASIPEADRKSGKWDTGRERNKVYRETAKRLGMTPLSEDEIATFQSAYIALNDLYENTTDPDLKKTLDKYNFTPVGVGDEKFGKKKNISKVDSWFGNTTLGQAVTPKRAPAPAAPAAPKPSEPVQPNAPVNYPATYQATPWWLQDKINIAQAVSDRARLRKYLGWAPKNIPNIPDRAFIDPTRQLAANAEQMAIGTQGAAAFASPQQFNARFSQIQGQGAANAANILGNTNTQNVGIYNQTEGIRAGIYNRANELNAANTKAVYDGTTIANQQYDNSVTAANNRITQNLVAGITNRAQAQAMNTMYPDYKVLPNTGGYVAHFPGVRRPGEEPSSFTGDDFETWKKANYPNMDTKEASEIYKNIGLSQGQQRRNRRNPDPREFYYPGGRGGYGGYPGYTGYTGYDNDPGYGYYG